jgi:hypothetical protein
MRPSWTEQLLAAYEGASPAVKAVAPGATPTNPTWASAGVKVYGMRRAPVPLAVTVARKHQLFAVGRPRGNAVGDVGLDVHEVGVDPEHRGGADAGEHEQTVRARTRGM